MDHQKIVVLMDDSAVNAYKAEEAKLKATLGSNWTITRLTGSQFRDMPLEEDIFTTSVTCHSAEKEGGLKKAYYFCGDTTLMNSDLTNKAVDFVQAQGYFVFWINTNGDNFDGLKEAITDFADSPSFVTGEPPAPPVAKLALKPKVVNLVIIGVNGPSVTNGSSVPISSLVDEMTARGGQIFDLFQKQQTKEEMLSIVDAIEAERTDPARHPETVNVVVSDPPEWPGSEQRDADVLQRVRQLFKLEADSARPSRLFYARGRVADHEEVQGIYDLLAQALMHNLPAPKVNMEAFDTAHRHLQHAQELMVGVGKALEKAGQDAPQRRYQPSPQHNSQQPDRYPQPRHDFYRTHGVEGPQQFNGNPGAFEFQRNGARFGDFVPQPQQWAFQQQGHRFGDFTSPRGGAEMFNYYQQLPSALVEQECAYFKGSVVLHVVGDANNATFTTHIEALKNAFPGTKLSVLMYPLEYNPQQLVLEMDFSHLPHSGRQAHVIVYNEKMVSELELANAVFETLANKGAPPVYCNTFSADPIDRLKRASLYSAAMNKPHRRY